MAEETIKVSSLKGYVDDLQDELDRLTEAEGKTANYDQTVLKETAYRLGELLRGNRTKDIAALLNSNLVGVFIVGQGPVLQYTNARAREILGSNAQIRHILSADNEVFYLADQMTACANRLPWLRALSGQNVDGDLIFVRSTVDSGDKWIKVCALPQRQHGQEAIVASIVLIIDTTQQVQSEHRLRQIKQALQERLAATPSAVLLSGEPAQADKRRALLADDMQINQLLLTAQLNKLGFTVHLANNGKEAVEAAARNKYDVIILDCEMPIMDGYTAAKAIRAGERDFSVQTPILAVTDYNHASDRAKFMAAGSDNYIQKGWDLALLQEMLAALVRGDDMTAGGAIAAGALDQPAGGFTLGPPMPDLEALEKLYGKERLIDIAALFVASAESSLDFIQAGLSDRDARATHHFAYCLKGPSALLGSQTMALLCEAIAETAIRGMWFDADDHFADLRAAFRKLNKLLQPSTAGGAMPEKARRKTKTLALSLDLLEQRVGKQTALAMAHAFSQDTIKIIEQMRGSIRKYDYEQLQIDAQKLAGCCAAIFIAKELRGLSKQLEALCNEEHVDWIEVSNHVDGLSKSYIEVKAQIETYVKANEVA